MSNHELQEMIRLIEEARRDPSPQKAEERLKASGYLKEDGSVDEFYENLDLPTAA